MCTYEDIKKASATIKTLDIKGKDYAQVNERVKAFRMNHPQGCIETEIVSLTDNKVVMKAYAYNEDHQLLGTGHAYEIEGSSNINRTSYIENCETSAIGRALAACGYGLNVSYASYEEMQGALEQQASTGKKAQKAAPAPAQPQPGIGADRAMAFGTELMAKGIDINFVNSLYKVTSLKDLTEKQFENASAHMDDILAKQNAEKEGK